MDIQTEYVILQEKLQIVFFLWLMPFVNLNNGYNYISYNHDPTMSNDFRDGIL